MNDGERAVPLPLGTGDDLPERLWAYDELTAEEERPAADIAAGFISLSFLRAALRRSARLWCVTAAIGLVAGLGVYVKLPPAYHAQTSILLTNNPDQDPISAMLTEQTVAQSRAVAARALQSLRLPQSLDSFLKAYTVTTPTDQVLIINVGAPSASQAVREANAIAATFLQFRKQQLLSQQQLVLTTLDQQIARSKQNVASINARITRLLAQPDSPARRARLNALTAQRGDASSALTVLEATTRGNQASTQVITATMLNESGVLDAAAPIAHSRYKLAIVYVLTGLVAGLAIGMVIVVVRALVSDRLRRRDDVAHALGAPVKLSTGAVRISRWLPGRRGLAAAQGRDVQRLVAHLRGEVPASSRGAPALAVVPVDDPQVAALALVSLAVSCTEEGRRVVVADLSSGAAAAHLLGVKEPGVRAVNVGSARFVVAVPDRNDVAPTGPLDPATPLADPREDGRGNGRRPADPRRTDPRGGDPAAAGEALAAAYASADLLLTLATLDPSVGGEHLATWATAVVAVVTAGQSTSTRIHAAGEMVRLAGLPLVSGVLIGADKTDESLGMVELPSPPVPAHLDRGTADRGVTGR